MDLPARPTLSSGMRRSLFDPLEPTQEPLKWMDDGLKLKEFHSRTGTFFYDREGAATA